MSALAVKAGPTRIQPLTEKQQAFVQALVGGGLSNTGAAKKAGYASPRSEAFALLRLPHVVQAIQEAQVRLVAVSGTNKALKTLMRIMDDPKAPASAQVSAAGKVLDMAGMFEQARRGGDDKPLHEMTYAELEKLVQRANDAAERLNAPIPGVIIPQGGGDDEEDQDLSP